ncbi:hypothetical protein Cgig2_019999 [Carnegiea gigantea]|uniref:Uncharacterized protein n=1 Tax=Carnegiea gigantea TaxID=171969 RepID=A0A9Q1QHW7_9CARY|nr:hypothetical protein Cgig2_019999 [Carnegiea gigantea]
MIEFHREHRVTRRYSWFIKIYLSAWEIDDLGGWIGWVKSRLPRHILKSEEVRHSCDPNPTEYFETGSSEAEPSVVFCWGLYPSHVQFDVALVEDFRNHLNGGPTGKSRLAVVQPAEFPSATQFPTRKVKGTKTCWKTPDYDQPTTPAISQHLPNHFMSYAFI